MHRFVGRCTASLSPVAATSPCLGAFRVEATQLAIKNQIEERTITPLVMLTETEADCLHLTRLEWTFCTNRAAGVPGYRILHDRIKLRLAHIISRSGNGRGRL